MIYFIIFSDSASSLAHQIFASENIWTSQAFFTILLAVLMLPLVLKKELKELKIASIILFFSIFAFIVLLIF